MKLETFFEKFELFADAPDAVAKMRELVLELAFSGGFTDSAAKQDGLPVGWERKTIESICSSITPGFACSRSYQVEDGHVHLRTHNISTLGTLNFDLLVRIDPKMVDAQKAFIRKGDILFNNTNSQELVGKTSLVDQDYDYGFSNHITRLRLKDNVFPGFVAFYLTFLRNSGYFAQLCTRWINQAAVNTETLKKETIPLPPLAEQKRIVAKVDELMALCDRLEAQQQERDTRHTALARAALARFAEAPTPANLDFLFHQSYAITPADLRKSILTLAVQGKLVPQDPNDEPTDELLVQCLAERQKYKQVAATSVQIIAGEDALGYGIPASWRWQALDDLLIFGPSNGFSPKAVDYETPVRSLTLSATTSGKFKGEHSKFITTDVPSDSELWLRDGDILVQRGNSFEYVGVAAVYRGEPNRFVYPDLMMKFRVSSALDVGFIHLAMSQDAARDYLRARASGTSGSMPKINQATLKSLPVPIPPLAEQRRIVAKVAQLMALVDQLESQLADAKAKSAALLEAIVHELLNPSAEVIDLASYRAAIGCYTISKISQQPYFGRTSAMKSLYLAEAHVGLKLGFQPEREAAGPLDHWIYRFEAEGDQREWFKAVENISNGKKKIEYQPGKMLAAQAALAESQLAPEQRKEFDRLLGLLSDKRTEEVEIIATLFAAWNDFLIDGHVPSDDEIVTEVRENWHERKERFTPAQLRRWLGWLRQHNLVPQGRLPRTVHQSKLLLN